MSDHAASMGSPFPRASAAPAFLRGPGAFALHYVMKRKWSFATLLTLVLCGSGCSVGVQYAIKVLVDGLHGGEGAASRPEIVVGLFIALMLGESVLGRLTGWLTCKTTVDSGVELRLDLFDYLSGHPMRYFADNLAGSLGQRITATAGHFGALVNTLVLRILPPIIELCGAVVIFTTINRAMTVSVALFVVAVIGALVWLGNRGRPLHRAYSGAQASNSGDLIDTIANMWTVKAFSARRREWARHRVRFEQEADAQRASWMAIERARFIHDGALVVLAGGVLVWILVLWRAGDASSGDVVVVFSLTMRILHSSRDMALSLVEIAQNFGFIDETLRVIGRPRGLDVPSAPARLSGSQCAIVFDNVSFGYAEGPDIVRDLNLHVPHGQKIGVVGPSGAGKSTLVHLLQRLHDVRSGHILIDGRRIDDLEHESLTEVLAVVPQEVSLFHRSVMENIRFARPTASDEEVFAAARAAASDGFIRALPRGYDTVLGERGAKLSGGQRQRIGIARAFLKNAPIIILDEATSALDTETELLIQDAINRLMAGRTVIAVAHRLSTLLTFDRVLVMENGRVVEDGGVAELRARGGVFERMWRVQAEGLAEADEVEKAAA